MRNTFDPDEFAATKMRIALNENFPEAIYGAISVVDQYELLEAYFTINADCHMSRRDMNANDIPTTASSMRKTRSQWPSTSGYESSQLGSTDQ